MKKILILVPLITLLAGCALSLKDIDVPNRKAGEISIEVDASDLDKLKD